MHAGQRPLRDQGRRRRSTSPTSVHYPGTYAAGVFNRLSDQVDGATIVNESLVNLPNWLVLAWAPDDEDWYPSGPVEVLEHHVELDLRHGTAHPSPPLRGRSWAPDPGRRSSASCTWRSRISPACTRRSPRRTGAVGSAIRSCIDARVENTGVARYRGLSGRHLEPRGDPHGRGRGPRRRADQPVPRCGSPSASAAASSTRTAAEVAGRPVDEPGLVGRDLYVDVRAGHPVTIEKIAALHTSRDPAVSEPAAAALEELRDAPDFRALLGPAPRRLETPCGGSSTSRLDDPRRGDCRPTCSPRSASASSTCCRPCPRTSSTSTSGCRRAGCTARPTAATCSGTSCSSCPCCGCARTGPRPGPARRTGTGGSRRRDARRRRSAAAARCSPGSRAATGGRRASGCTSTHARGTGCRT